MLGWTEERKAAVLFASEGNILEGLSAENAIAQGVAEEVVE